MKHAPVDVSRLLQPWMGGVGRAGNRFDAGGAIMQSLFALLRLSPHFERAAQTLEEAGAERDVGDASVERQPDREAAMEKLRVDIEESRKATAVRHREVDTAIDLIANDTSAQTEVLIVCPRHGRTGGRMHIVNPRSHPVQLSFVPRYGMGVPASYADSLGLTFSLGLTSLSLAPTLEPPHLSLAAGEACAVRIGIDLTRCPNDTVQKLAFHVDARHDNDCLAIVWVEVTIVDDVP